MTSFAVDVGGTFTDLVVLDEGGSLFFTKASTTPDDPSRGVFDAITQANLSLPDTSRFMHGTTLGINTVLEGKGAKVGLITTRGFRDTLEIGRMSWPMYQLHWTPPATLVPRYLRMEVSERTRADGTVAEPLCESDAREAIKALLAEGVDSIAVCFLNSYVNPEHEAAVGRIFEVDFPDVSVALSHQVALEYREWERTVTTVVEGAIRPRMAGYIDALDSGLDSRGFGGEFFVTRADGGVMTASEGKRRSVRTLVSGPASGIMGAAALARVIEEPRIIAADMGGTSFDAALIIDQQPVIESSTRLEDLPLLIPVVDLATIGAGGGSIAWIDAGGALEVGPQSAGADPGPACYGRGGTDPTFTDAALVSGLIDPEYFLGGTMSLDATRAQRALEEIAGPLGLDVEEAATGVVALIEAKMAATLEELTVGEGHDPREFAVLAYGGGGSLVASGLATRLGLRQVIVPRSPGTFSAWGSLTLDLVHDFVRTVIGRLEDIDQDEVSQIFSGLAEEGLQALSRDDVPGASQEMLFSVDMRYFGQEHTLSIPVGSRAASHGLDVADLRGVFDRQHQSSYGYSLPDPVEIVSYRLRAVGSLEKPRTPELKPAGESAEHALKGSRRAAHRHSGGAFEWNVYDRDLLAPGNAISGPAIIEEEAATTLVAPHQELQLDQFGNLRISPIASAAQESE